MTNAQLADLLEEAARRLRAVPVPQTIRREVLAVNQKDAAAMLGISVDYFVTLGIKPTKAGNMRRYRIERLSEYLDQQDVRRSR